MPGWLRVAVALSLSLAISGCGMGDLLLSPEEKINRAFPPAAQIGPAEQVLLAETPAAQSDGMHQAFEARLRERATTCAKGYKPSWYTTSSAVRTRITDVGCFADADRGILRWIGYRRIAPILARPALRPIPAAPVGVPRFESRIVNATFATRAGVVLVATTKSGAIVDLENGKVLYSVADTGAASISPNGRLFTFVEGERIAIRDSETGKEVAAIDGPKRRGPVAVPSEKEKELWARDPQSAKEWAAIHAPGPLIATFVDDRTLYYKRMVEYLGPIVIVDIPTGREALVELDASAFYPVAGEPDRFVVSGRGKSFKYELVRGKPQLELKLLDEKGLGTTEFLTASTLTSDGSRYVEAHGTGLDIVDLARLATERVELGPFPVTSVSAAKRPDEVLVRGPDTREGRETIVYSLRDKTVARVGDEQALLAGLRYVPSLGKFAAFRDQGIAFLDDVPAGEPVALAKFTTDLQLAKADAKLGIAPVGAAPAKAAGAPPPLAALAATARIEAVGVYQAASKTYKTAAGRLSGPVQILVRRSDAPLILVLASYEAVRWTLTLAPGARVDAVLVSGYEQGDLVGAENARVIDIGRAHPYKSEGKDYDALSAQVARTTGKSIARFQGSYSGSSFSVGGR